ncbi:hypothetical protein PILCRDRAFT_16154 [Piloderma croceum F 1598]|uniref:Uncharacterized protein n=1 Tax=Piloderma croceum (strain F 1598) TaxID=765440 RepID=A0A0C3B540_PILCF|nr:hypothetical protein PILCRDRAFT_16154 [Piloderma croceum F 1598]
MVSHADSELRGGFHPTERLSRFVSSARGLDALYLEVLRQAFNPHDHTALSRFKLVMGRILATEEPLSISAHSERRGDHDSADLVELIVPLLGTLLSGIQTAANLIMWTCLSTTAASRHDHSIMTVRAGLSTIRTTGSSNLYVEATLIRYVKTITNAVSLYGTNSEEVIRIEDDGHREIRWLMKVHLLHHDFDVDHGSNIITGRNVVFRSRKYSSFNQLRDRNALPALDANHEFTGKFDVVVFMPPQMPAFPAMTDEPAADSVSQRVVALGIANATCSWQGIAILHVITAEHYCKIHANYKDSVLQNTTFQPLVLAMKHFPMRH